MTAAELVEDLRTAGVTLRLGSGRPEIDAPAGLVVEIDAPVGLVTEQVLTELQHLKPEILDLLEEEAAAQRKEWAEARLCVGCRRFALSRPGLLCYWCRDLRTQAPTTPSQAIPENAG
jgi:hypothetical protein